MVNILEGTRDKWFRPSDVCTAPDGSLIIADWYDPGVGGHRMGDIERGRIFRVAPPKTAYKAPKLDLSTAAGAIEGLKSPNLVARYMAWTKLHSLQNAAEMPLADVFRKSEDQRLRARVLWLLSKIQACGREYVEEALADRNADIRITALRAARQAKLDVVGYVKQLAKDKSPQVRRECLIALRHDASAEMPSLWADLAKAYDGKDRWYLEALGIAADKQWDKCLDAWLAAVGNDWDTPRGHDIIWRSRAKETPSLLVKVLASPTAAKSDPARYLRALDFLTGPERDAALLELAFAKHAGDATRGTFINTEAIRRLKNVDLKANPKYAEALADVLNRSPGTPQFVELVDKFNVKEKYADLLAMAQKDPDQQLGIDAVRVLLAKDEKALLQSALGHKDEQLAAATARVLGNSADGRIVGLLRPVMADAKRPLELRRAAVRSMAKTRNGAQEILTLARQKKLDEGISTAAAFELHSAPPQWGEIKAEAEKLFPLPPARNNEKLPPISQLVKMQGDVARGAKVYAGVGTCAKCHKVNGEGKDVGPDLSAIGSKLSREAFFESVLYPSAGISHNYETYNLLLDSGNTVSGIVTSQTGDSVTIVTQDAITRTFKRSEIERMAKSNLSMMPADLQKVMSAQELADVVEYMMTLKQAKKPVASGKRGASAP
jgi:putative heme-binding domain-containing protein